MIGFKYTNIKIQTAYIKFLMYSYLYNLFLLQPAYYYKFILSEFSKDSLSGENSKQQFDKFIKDNKALVDNFYSVIEKVDQQINGKNYKKNKITNYVWLTCVLKKDIKTNFSLLTNNEIESIGREEIINLLFDTFFVVLEEIKEKYKLNIKDLRESIYKEIGSTKDGKNLKIDLAKNNIKFDGSLQDLVSSCRFIENIKDINNFQDIPIFSTYTNDSKLFQQEKEDFYKQNNLLAFKFEQIMADHGDFPTTIEELLNENYMAFPHSYNDYEIKSGANSYSLLKNDLQKIVDDIGYKGFCGQVFFKIKEQVDVQFRCGSEASKNPVTISFRAADNKYDKNQDFIYVQKFFDWKKDKSYFDLEQFILVRQSGIEDILKYDEINKGTIKLQKTFNDKSHFGVKFIEGNDIYILEEKLKNSGSDIGFLALIPIKRADKNLIDLLISDQKLNFYIGVFSEPQRNLRMSYGDLTRLLCKNYNINEYSFDKYNEDNTVPKTLSNLDNGKRNIDLDDLIDCYFSIYLNEFTVKEYLLGPKKIRYTFEDLLSVKNETGKFKLKPDINNKEGNFILLLEKATKVQNKDGQDISFYMNIEKKHVSSIKINNKNKKIFQDFQLGFQIISKEPKPEIFKFSKLIDFKDLENPQLYSREFGNLASIKIEGIDNIFLRHIKENFLQEIINSFINNTSSKEKDILEGIFQGLNNPEENILFKLISNTDLNSMVNNYSDNNFRKTRAYRNIVDFIKYYKGSVESLAKEVQDNV